MLKQFKYRDIVWLDLESPTPSEVENIGREHRLHPLVLAELGNKKRPAIDAYADFVYLTLHFPTPDGRQEIDFIISRDFIITAHYEPVNSLNNFAKIFEQNHGHAGFVFFYMLREIYTAVENDLPDLNHRQMLDYQWTMRAHQSILESFALTGSELFGAKFHYYLQTICGEERRLWQTLEQNRANFQDQRAANQSLILNKINKMLKILTVIVAIFLVAFIITQIKLWR